jgi:hypothetical protein
MRPEIKTLKILWSFCQFNAVRNKKIYFYKASLNLMRSETKNLLILKKTSVNLMRSETKSLLIL